MEVQSLAGKRSAILGFALVASLLVTGCGGNARVVRELREDPHGERAKKVMLLTLPSGKELPVNYLRDGERVYCAADFPWWRELDDAPGRGSVLIQGETLYGTLRVVRDDPELRDAIFDRLRPTAPRFLGTMVVMDVDPPAAP